jgi:hypothetical protein
MSATLHSATLNRQLLLLWLALSPAAHQTVCEAARAAAAGSRNRCLSCKHITHWIALKSTPLAARQQAGSQVRSWCRRHQQRCQGGHRHTRSMLLLARMLHCLLLLQLQERLPRCACSAGCCLQLAAACARPVCQCSFDAPCRNAQESKQYRKHLGQSLGQGAATT